MRKEFIAPQIVLKMPRQENQTVAARAAWTQEKQMTLGKIGHSHVEQKCMYESSYGENVQYHG
jgi:hypothetical protein